jgi:hypothetical protein
LPAGLSFLRSLRALKISDMDLLVLFTAPCDDHLGKNSIVNALLTRFFERGDGFV